MKVWEKEIFGRKLRIEYGKMAKQANGSVLVRFGDSALLVTACASSKPLENVDFLPLTVEYQERFYAAGKIPGGFIKREGKPSENAILSARLIDRPIRPLFPKEMRHEIQIVATVLSADPDDPPDTWGIMGASLALNLSDIPFNGIVAGVRVGYINGEFKAFPTEREMEESKLDIVVAGTEEAVTMVEGEAKEVTEEEMLNALSFAHDAIRQLVSFQKEILSEFEIEKFEIEKVEPPEGLIESFDELIDEDKLRYLILTPAKHERDKALKSYRDELLERFFTKRWPADEREQFEGFLKEHFEDRLRDKMRKMVLEEGIRADGRKPDDIRPITCEVGIFPRTHGSALFTRGETQSLGIVTLGAPMDEQIIDTLLEEGSKRFMLHYNFPPYSTGEVKPMRGPSRREIGHGHLAERALKNMLPPEEEFPYTIRVVSEILESNGSSSMATVCSGSLSLMDAGVPIRKHVAGVAMGLIIEGEKAVVLTDILGMEDHLGDMDFKVAGTRDGITAFQMDVKVSGVSEEIMREALEKARQARMKILDVMEATISSPRSSLSPHAPIIKLTSVPVDKIGEVIGPGGRIVKWISKEFDVSVYIDDETGQVKVSGNNVENVDQAITVIQDLVKDVEVGQEFEGKITRIEPYGMFIEVKPGKIGLLHSSKMSSKLKDFAKKFQVGDRVRVVITDIDNLGRLQLKEAGFEPPDSNSRRGDRSTHTSARPTHRPSSHRNPGHDRRKPGGRADNTSH
ncbi:MAG: polyribonucleotide nucleotidyltransferase [Thermotogota bacterium]|nr:polyribonucleotide nucleotidyltransferase [Thermotogota bacterium]HCZ07342.1 polyribonucleotide nucleotidyltransferase [Thermotogota bacterium]